PTYENHYNADGRYNEYVESAKFNEDWVIAKSIQIEDKRANYWLIDKGIRVVDEYDCDKTNCDSIRQSFVSGPFDLKSFQNKLKELDIDLTF
ncbi:MAG: hypothetical protein P8N54_07345, partial [Flavobacteriales bacterium]|nr:hypothetical protein [Flavobacteriales bacterium]